MSVLTFPARTVPESIKPWLDSQALSDFAAAQPDIPTLPLSVYVKESRLIEITCTRQQLSYEESQAVLSSPLLISVFECVVRLATA